ncbi:MAG TPA: NADH-quinone oxidoreductase subunit M, partial [Chromatiaceae bacterium]|nr:NADH-quinone oxidoreductase subunit M [Chromatiaceae bacterium]
MHHLTLLLILPIVGVLLLALIPARRLRLIRGLALTVTGIEMIASWWLLRLFDSSDGGMQLLERVVWNPRLGTAYAVGIDGLSLPMVLLATLLCFVAVLASTGIQERARGYFGLLLMLESAMLGVFLAQDWSLFYIFWELTL